MLDLHTHSFFSDGALSPAELVRRAESIGYTHLGISDHADSSNLDHIIPRLVKLIRETAPFVATKVLPGVELTHVPPPLIGILAQRARDLGAAYVVVHGETMVEPVPPGTNRAAILAGVDILAHPGLITREDAALAAERNVVLEITARKGHSLSNGHVAGTAKAVGASLVLNTDSHDPGDLITRPFGLKVVLGAGLTERDFEEMQANSLALFERATHN
ncbi:MAG: histidinol phosphate phosphatase domain-containing protein [Pseudomonadota bacterium]